MERTECPGNASGLIGGPSGPRGQREKVIWSLARGMQIHGNQALRIQPEARVSSAQCAIPPPARAYAFVSFQALELSVGVFWQHGTELLPVAQGSCRAGHRRCTGCGSRVPGSSRRHALPPPFTAGSVERFTFLSPLQGASRGSASASSSSAVIRSSRSSTRPWAWRSRWFLRYFLTHSRSRVPKLTTP